MRRPQYECELYEVMFPTTGRIISKWWLLVAAVAMVTIEVGMFLYGSR